MSAVRRGNVWKSYKTEMLIISNVMAKSRKKQLLPKSSYQHQTSLPRQLAAAASRLAARREAPM